MNSLENQYPTLQVDVSPEMQIYRILQHLSYGIETALAELIDNSIQSYIEGCSLNGNEDKHERLLVRIDIDDNNITLTDNAYGISRANIQRALKPGYDGSHPTESLSVYGIGMKSAALWFTDNWQIKTSVPGEAYSINVQFNLPELLKNQRSTEPAVFEDEADSAHYTIIKLKNISRSENKEYYEKVVLPFLLETFIKFDHFLDIEIYYNNLILSPNPKKLFLTVPEAHTYPVVNSKGIITGNVPIEWKIELNFRYNDRSVKGFILLMETGSYGQPGIRLLRNKRVIEGTSVYPNVPEELLGTKNKYAAQRVYGELELDDFPVDFMKTKFNENLNDLFKHINQRLTKNYHYNLIKQATSYRKKVAEQIESINTAEEIASKVKAIRADSPSPVIKSALESEEAPCTSNDNIKPSSSGNLNQHSTGEEDASKGSTGNDNKPSTEQPTPQNTTSSAGSNSSGGKFEPMPENRIELSEALRDAFSQFSGDKLPRLYISLCTISLKQHSVMCYMGAWALLECWSSALGKNDTTDFFSFLTPKIKAYASDRGKRNDILQVLRDIQSKGNCNKHSGIYANTHALDLKSHLIILEPFILYETNLHLTNAEAN